MKPSANHAAVKSPAHWGTMKTAYRAVETTGANSSRVEPSADPGMKSRAPMKSSMNSSVMHMEAVVDKTSMREETTVRVKDSAKPAREGIKEWARIIAAGIIVRVIRIRIAIIPADVGHRRCRRRGRRCRVCGIICAGRVAGRHVANYRRLAGIGTALVLRNCGCMSLIVQFTAAFQHRSQYRCGNTHITQLDNLIGRRLEWPGRVFDERQHNGLIHTRLAQRNDFVDASGKLGSSAGRNRADGIAWLSGIGFNRARGKADTGNQAAKGKE